MAIRRVVEELEARLEPAAQSASPHASHGASHGASRGKLEFKRYGDGRRRMKITCKGLDLADGTRLELLFGDLVVALLEVRNGRAEIDEERDGADEAPALAAGEFVTLCHQGVPVLSGRLYLD